MMSLQLAANGFPIALVDIGRAVLHANNSINKRTGLIKFGDVSKTSYRDLREIIFSAKVRKHRGGQHIVTNRIEPDPKNALRLIRRRFGAKAPLAENVFTRDEREVLRFHCLYGRVVRNPREELSEQYRGMRLLLQGAPALKSTFVAVVNLLKLKLLLQDICKMLKNNSARLCLRVPKWIDRSDVRP